MKIAMIVPHITGDMEANLRTIRNFIADACENGASLVLLPETVLTGLSNTDDYAHDIKLAISIRHDIVRALRDMARACKIWLCFGFFENDGGCIYDSAVLIDPAGEIAIHHRRISPHWHAQNASPAQYAQGSSLSHAATPLGKTALVICGDLFDEDVLSMLDEMKPDVVLFPFARCFSPKYINSQRDWDRKGIQEYAGQAKRVGAALVMANIYAGAELGGGFGGAAFVGKNGGVLASFPLCREGILYYEL